MNAPCLAPIFDDATLRTTCNSASMRSLPTWSKSKLFGCTDVNFETITVWPLRKLTEIKKLRKWTFSSTDTIVAIGVLYQRILTPFTSEKMNMWASTLFYFQLPSFFSPFFPGKQTNKERKQKKEQGTREICYNCKSVPLWVLHWESTWPSQDHARTHSDGARRRASCNSKPYSARDWSREASR
jgi:hypothetical protein